MLRVIFLAPQQQVEIEALPIGAPHIVDSGRCSSILAVQNIEGASVQGSPLLGPLGSGAGHTPPLQHPDWPAVLAVCAPLLLPWFLRLARCGALAILSRPCIIYQPVSEHCTAHLSTR